MKKDYSKRDRNEEYRRGEVIRVKRRKRREKKEKVRKKYNGRKTE